MAAVDAVFVLTAACGVVFYCLRIRRRAPFEIVLGACLAASLAICVWGDTQSALFSSALRFGDPRSQEEVFAPDEVCVEGGNPRTASLFQRGVLEAHGSPLRYRYIDSSYQCPGTAAYRLKLFSGPTPPSALTEYWKVPGEASTYSNVIDGDEYCSYRGDYAKDNVVARQYDSTGFPTGLAYLPLGARFEFDVVLPPPSPTRRRKYAMNFVGSVDTDKSREALKKVVETAAKPNPGMKSALFAFGNWTASPTNDSRGHLSPKEYRDVVLDSDFTLAPAGHNMESFRFWEAIEAGSIPVMLKRAPTSGSCTDSFEQVLCTQPPIVVLESWDDLYETLSAFSERDLAVRRARLAAWSQAWWRRISQCLAGKILPLGAKAHDDCQACTQRGEEQAFTKDDAATVGAPATGELPDWSKIEAPAFGGAGVGEPLPWLVTGCGRSGSHGIDELLRKIGLGSLHEHIGTEGAVSWPHAWSDRHPGERLRMPFTNRDGQVRWGNPEFRFSSVAHFVYHPLAAVASLVVCLCGNPTAALAHKSNAAARAARANIAPPGQVDMAFRMSDASFDYARAEIPGLPEEEVERAMTYWVRLNAHVEERSSFLYHVGEPELEALVVALGYGPDRKPQAVAAAREADRALRESSGGRARPVLCHRVSKHVDGPVNVTWPLLRRTNAALAQEMKEMAERYGYAVEGWDGC